MARHLYPRLAPSVSRFDPPDLVCVWVSADVLRIHKPSTTGNGAACGATYAVVPDFTTPTAPADLLTLLNLPLLLSMSTLQPRLQLFRTLRAALPAPVATAVSLVEMTASLKMNVSPRLTRYESFFSASASPLRNAL